VSRLLWCGLFLLVPILGVATFAAGPVYNIWLPEDISVHGRVIDHLFMFILWLTGVVFVITEVILFWFMWKYDKDKNHEPVKYTHGSHSLEVVWTILPAATLLFIAIYQMDAWAASKMRVPNQPVLAEVVGRQFEWRLRYAGQDGQLYTPDDIFHVNDLHLPAEEEILLMINSEDVLHSFFLPNLRIKQDLVPGMQQYVWFKAQKPFIGDIVCAELCGWGHYKMKGRVTIEPRAEFEAWLKERQAAQETRTEPELEEE